jgi:transposase
MSRMPDSTRPRRAKRVFDDEFKAQAVRLVLEEGKSASAVARDLGLTPSMFRIWVARRGAATGPPPSAKSSPGSARKCASSGPSVTS